MILSEAAYSIRVVSIRPLLLVVALGLLVPGQALGAPLRPDLDQVVPRNLTVTIDRSGAVPRFHLGFTSSINNVGAGPIVIDAHRPSGAYRQMTADQTVFQDDGTTRTIPAVGHLEYVYSEDHEHWHYLGFDHYQVRRASDNRFVAPDRKTGFCLGDRFETHPGETQPGKPTEPTLASDCGQRETGRVTLREGISVGYGDIYYATVEGQFVDITGVPAGRYYLVHRVNANRKLRESDYSNNAASVLISVSWPHGKAAEPTLHILRRCPDTASCPGSKERAVSSGAVTQSSERPMAFDDALLDGIRFRPVVDEIPSFIRHPLGRLGSGPPAE